MSAPWPRRALDQRTGLALVGAVAALAVLLVMLVVGFTVRGQATAVRATLASTPATRLGDVLSTAPLDDRAAQDAAVRRLVARRLPGVRVDVVPTTTSGPLTAKAGARSGGALVIERSAAIGRAIEVVRGTSGGVLVDVAGARLLHTGPGTRLTLDDGGTRLAVTVSGVWRERDPGAAVWGGLDPGAQGSAARLVVPAGVPAALGDATAQWSVTPAALAPQDLQRVARGLAALPAAAGDDARITATAVVATDGGVTTLTTMQRAIDGADALLPGAIAVLVIAAALALLLLAGLVFEDRDAETRLLVSRGASVAALLRVAAVEGGVAIGLGAAIGTGVAIRVLAAVGPPMWPIEAVAPVAVAIGAEVLLLVAARARLLQAFSGPPPRRRLAVALPASLLAVAAAICTWRFVTAEGPGLPPDPVGALAPATLLAAAAVAVVLLLPRAVTTTLRLAVPRRGPVLVTAARRLARGVAVLGAVVSAIALAVGSTTATAAFVGTWRGFVDTGALTANGADVRADYDGLTGAGGSDALLPLASVSKLPGVTRAVAARSTDATLLGEDVRVVAADVPGLRTAERGVAVPASGSAALTATGSRGDRIDAALWVQSTAGQMRRVPLGALRPAAVTRVRYALPAGAWRLVAIDLAVTSPGTVRVALDSITAAGHEVALPRHWPLAPAVDSGGPTDPLTDALGAEVGPGRPGELVADPSASGTVEHDVRLVASTAPVPVVAGGGAAAALALTRGTRLQMVEQSSGFTGILSGTVPVVPGTSGGGAFEADLASVERGELATSAVPAAPNEIRITTDRPDAVAALLTATAAAPRVSVADTGFPHRFVDGTVLGLVLAGAGTLVSAIVVLAVAIVVLARRRSAEVGTLRALGVAPGQQAAMRVLECGGAATAGLLAGLVAGTAVGALTAVPLARLADGVAPAELVPVAGLDPGLLASGLAGAVAATAVVLAVTALRVSRAAQKGA